MAAPNQSDCRNRLLALMSEADFALLAADLSYVQLPRGRVIAEADGPIDGVFFVEAGMVSIVAESPEGHKVEAGLFGREGMGPTPAVLGSDRSSHELMVQIPDDAYRIDRTALVRAMDESSTLRSMLLRYVQAFSVQMAFTALSNAVHSIDERLARWLLMCHDRVEGNEIALTHEFISIMLAVRRPSVTTALHVLEGNRFIRSERGHITIRDRTALEEFAGDAYGKPEAEYRRLIGPAHGGFTVASPNASSPDAPASDLSRADRRAGPLDGG